MWIVFHKENAEQDFPPCENHILYKRLAKKSWEIVKITNYRKCYHHNGPLFVFFSMSQFLLLDVFYAITYVKYHMSKIHRMFIAALSLFVISIFINLRFFSCTFIFFFATSSYKWMSLSKITAFVRQLLRFFYIKSPVISCLLRPL